MSWLDSPACSSDTNEESNSQMVVSSFSVSSGGTVTPVAPPVTPPTAPQTPASQYCGSTGCTINQYWVEFTPPSGTSNPPATATATCTSTSSTTFTITCNWYSAGSKYQCSSSNICNAPVPYYNSKPCPFAAAAVGDSVAQLNTDGLSTTIIGVIAAVAAVVGIALVVLVVFIVTKKKQTEEYV